jgi:uncharacterized protein
MKVYHHNDHDGRCSAAIVFNFFKSLNKELVRSIEFYEVNYPVGDTIEPPGLDNIKDGERIYILDYHFEDHYINKIMEKTRNITWIDHHKTSLDYSYINEIHSILDISKAACMLTWEYFHDEPAPYAVRLIQAWDIWDLGFSPYVEPFKEGLYLYDHMPTDSIWDLILDPSLGTDTIIVPLSNIYDEHHPIMKIIRDNHPITEIIQRGEICLEYKNRKNKQYIEELSFEAIFNGYKCIVCGIPEGSKIFGDKINDYDIGITYSFNGVNWAVSLYSAKDIDVSEIARQYGGGGHKGAAGYTTTRLPEFLRKDPISEQT